MTQLRNKLSTEYYCVCIFSYNNEEIEAGKRIGDISSGAELQTRELCSSPGIGRQFMVPSHSHLL
jgi:hypothetical protein